jgi:hypothetical protein
MDLKGLNVISDINANFKKRSGNRISSYNILDVGFAVKKEFGRVDSLALIRCIYISLSS